MTKNLTVPPGNSGGTFLNFPLVANLDELQADFVIPGIPYGTPYDAASMANDQSTAPDVIRQTPTMADIEYTKNHFDWDLGGPLFAGKDIRVVDCGNVNADAADHKAHYRDAQLAARKIFSGGAMGIRRINPISASSARHIIPLKLSLAPVLEGIW